MKTLRRTIPTVAPIVLLCASIGCATTLSAGQDGGEPTWSDAKITQELEDRFAASVAVERHDIDIDTFAGHVNLAGIVEHESEAEAAERIARQTYGVVSVDNALIVDPGFHSGVDLGFDDRWIEEMVHYKLGSATVVEPSEVDVRVEAGVVELSGVVDTMQARVEAHTLAGSVDGVVDVVNDLEVAEFKAQP